jgi:hypothetical protein
MDEFIPQPPALRGMSLVHLVRHHSGVPDVGHIIQIELSGTNLLAPMPFRWGWETERILGYALPVFCKTLSCLYQSVISSRDGYSDIHIPVGIVCVGLGSSTRVRKGSPVVLSVK